MKILLTYLAVVLLVGGCTTPSAKTTATHPSGTEVGTSFPGVNQGTTDTTATRSYDTYH